MTCAPSQTHSIHPVSIKTIIIFFKNYFTFIYMCTCMLGYIRVHVCTRIQGKVSEDNLCELVLSSLAGLAESIFPCHLA